MTARSGSLVARQQRRVRRCSRRPPLALSLARLRHRLGHRLRHSLRGDFRGLRDLSGRVTGCGWAAIPHCTACCSPIRATTTLINTLLFVAIGVNVKIFLAFLLSGFFMSRSWWVRSLLAIYLLPWALPGLTVFLSIHYMLVTEWGLLDSLWRAVTGEDGPLFLVSPRWRWGPISYPTSGNGCRSGH